MYNKYIIKQIVKKAWICFLSMLNVTFHADMSFDRRVDNGNI